MIHTCELCGGDFLTEADAYIVRPTPQGVKLYCYCMIKGFDEMKGAEKLKEENKKLVEALKFYADTKNWSYTDSAMQYDLHGTIIDDCFTEGLGEGGGVDFGGKRARQVLKEIGKE